MISVIIVTYDRIKDLAECLESLRIQNYDDFEVILIDNGSRHSPEDAIQFAMRERIRLVRNPEGVSLTRCRNLGMDLTRGEIIAFTDDDCVVGENWLGEIEAAIGRYDAVGGVVLPYGEVDYPRWWHREMNWFIGLSTVRDYKALEEDSLPVLTSNLAFKSEVAQRTRFEDVPCISHKNMTREDVEFWRHIGRNHFKRGFNERQIVYHKIPPERLTPSYAMKRCLWDGLSAGRTARGSLNVSKALRSSLAFLPRMLASLLLGHSGSRIYTLCWIIRQAAFAYGYLSPSSPRTG